MYTIVETAKVNNANVYFYLKYVLEKMPRYMEQTDLSFLEAMMPWSVEYKEYERSQTSGINSEPPPGIFTSKPCTPRKKCGSGVDKNDAA